MAGIAESAAERLVDQPSLLVALAAPDPVAAAVSGHQEGCFQNDATVLLARGTRAGCRRRPLAVPQVAQGLADVVTALAEANVDTLLIGDPGDAEAWIGEIAVDRAVLGFGVENGREQRAVRRAAMGLTVAFPGSRDRRPEQRRNGASAGRSGRTCSGDRFPGHLPA